MAPAATEANQACAGGPTMEPPNEPEELLVPLDCVCNLCDCGAHTCTNFRPRGMKCPAPVKDNRCGKMASECLCSEPDDERYLARPKPRPTTTEAAADNNEDEELLHVLVTRPALAGKPRDNIVLEGDMDLRTTFETTYERLARMRLEHWKRCQEEQEEQEANKEAAVESDDARAQVSFVDQSSLDDNGEAPAKPNGRTDLEGGNETPPSTLAPGANGNFIDPDLSSIIVYDANLDRLQRVGLRKRSKYRPSTSLRPGGFGLFGDPAPPTKTTTIENGGTQHQEQNEPVGAKEEPKRQLTPSQLVMDARNLMHSNQSNRLVYSNINLPIDSKRKCRDNVNMIDHIKEQNIVEKRTPQVDGDFRAPKVSSVSDEKLASAIDKPNKFEYEDYDETNMRLLAQQEEAEALEELQRLTRSVPEQEQAVNLSQSRGGTTSNGKDTDSRADDYLRRSRLHRTCQNQNFDIYNNDYRDTPGDQSSSSNLVAELSKFSTRASPVANNLFRESPDFIMTTTGKYLDEFAAHKLTSSSLSGNIYNVYTCESRRESKEAEPNDANEVLEEAADEGRQVSMTPCDQCRVLRLSNEFQYVGSKEGHNYFVEHPHQ